MSFDYYLGIEFGSTRIKAQLIDDTYAVVATGSHTWENQLIEGQWSYRLEDVWTGVREAYAELAGEAERVLGHPLTTCAAIGVSAMMHGYLAFDESDELLVPFRTWRNTTTAQASEELTRKLNFTIPQRWSIAHLYQAVLNGEEHVSRIRHLTTLAGYVHFMLTGERVLGVGDASGMFPIGADNTWDQDRLDIVQTLVDEHHAGVDLDHILPEVRAAGQITGRLTGEGALLLDPTGRLLPGIPFCPPEGDAGTGMVATNAVAPRTGNISAGTSIFAMVVLDRDLAHLHPEIDMVTTPAGDSVAMVHCNNGASEIDAWAQVFGQFAARTGNQISQGQVFEALFGAALEGEPDGGGLLAYNYLAGEPVTGLEEGRPLIVRTPSSRLTLENFMRTLIMSSFATLSLGMRILADENVRVEKMFAQGGIFATEGVAQRLLAAALDTPVSVGRTASEGGAWGMAVLAAYAAGNGGLGLTEYLANRVFASVEVDTLDPDPADIIGYARFLAEYERGLAIQRAAVASC